MTFDKSCLQFSTIDTVQMKYPKNHRVCIGSVPFTWIAWLPVYPSAEAQKPNQSNWKHSRCLFIDVRIFNITHQTVRFNAVQVNWNECDVLKMLTIQTVDWFWKCEFSIYNATWTKETGWSLKILLLFRIYIWVTYVELTSSFTD